MMLLAGGAATGSTPVKLMSYNVRNGNGIDGVSSTTRIAEVIKREAPLVVAVEEVDSVTGRSGGRYVLGDIARACGMKAYYSPAISYDGGKYGIGVLSAIEPVAVRRYPLPGREEARTLIVVELPGFTFAATHLSLTAEDCAASVEIIRRVAAESKKPFFIAGDFNAHPDSEVMADFARDFTVLTDPAVQTFPADNPTETIDYILLYNPDRKPTGVTSAAVVNEPAASDHRPVTIEISL